MLACAVVSVASFAATVDAKQWPGADGEQSKVDDAVATMTHKKFIVIYMDSLDSGDRMSNALNYARNTPSLQKAISENKSLTAELKAEGVQLRNVTAADEAADGSITFYVQ